MPITMLMDPFLADAVQNKVTTIYLTNVQVHLQTFTILN